MSLMDFYMMGAFFGKFIAGALFGLIPLIVFFVKRRWGLGVLSPIVCGLMGFINPLVSIVVCVILTVVAIIVHKKESLNSNKKSNDQSNATDPQSSDNTDEKAKEKIAKESEDKTKEKVSKAPAKKSSEKKSDGRLKNFLKSREARYGATATAIVIITVALVVVLNVVVNLLVGRFPNLKVDLTANSAYELNEDTADYMSHLDKDVDFNILSKEEDFIKNGEYFVQAKNLLEKMESASDGKLTVHYVDTTADPSFSQKYKNVDWTSKKNVALVVCGDRYKALTLDDCFEYDEQYASYGYYNFTATKIEQAAVTAILNVTTEDKVVVDILKGNQEADYSAIKTLLNDNAYQVNEISLLTSKFDEDAKFVVIFAPAVDYDESAIKKISDWLENGGKYGRTLIYVPNSSSTNTPNLNAFLEEWKLKLSDGFVYETSQDHLLNGVSPYAFITNYTDYYKENLKNPDIPVVTLKTRGITISDENTAHSLLDSTDKAGVVPYEPPEDFNIKNAITGEKISVAAESIKSGNDSQSRVIVFGSDNMFAKDFMTVNSFNNSAFLVNIFNSLSDKDDNSVTIESKALSNTELGVTDASTGAAMMIIFVITLPLAVLVIGLVIWIRRRNK